MGGIAAFLARNWMLSRTQETATTTTIVAAAKPLPFGTPLTADSVQEMPWAAKVIPAGSFTSKQALFKDGSRVALANIQENEPILSSKVTGPGQRASLSTLLDKDKRAITVRVDDVRGVAGFILPNDRVDVVLIRAVIRFLQSQTVGVTASGPLVIAIDQVAEQKKTMRSLPR
jgi:pilus assembly protein CpaB